MSTLAQLTGAPVVPATFQVTVCALAPTQVIPVLVGLVTTKGPAAELTVTVTFAEAVQPPPVALSRTVVRKVMVRATVGNTSQVKGPLAAKAAKLGKKRVGLVVGSKERKLAPAVAVAEGEVVAVPVLVCSQQ